MDPRTTTHRTRVQIPIFASSEYGSNTNTPKNSEFEQRLQPAIRVPLNAKNPRMHLEQCSLPYSMANVHTGADDSFDMSVNAGSIGYNPDLASMYSPAHVPAVILATAEQSYGGYIWNASDSSEHFVEIPFATLAATDGSVAAMITAINTVTQNDSTLTADLMDGERFYIGNIPSDAGLVSSAHLQAQTYSTWHDKSGYYGSTGADDAHFLTRLHSTPYHTTNGYGHFANGLAFSTEPSGAHHLGGAHDPSAPRTHTVTLDAVAYPFVTHGGKCYLSLHALLKNDATWASRYPWRAVDFWSPFTTFEKIAIPNGLYSMTDSMDETKRAAGHHTTTDVALAIKTAVSTGVPLAAARTSKWHFTQLTSYSADSYPVHLEPDLSINRVKMKVHNGVVVNAGASTSVVGKLLGFTGFLEGAIDAGPAAASVTAANPAQMDRGNRALFVHCSLCTGGYGANGKGGSTCIGSFPINHAPGSVITYAPSADPFKSRAPVAGALVDHIRWQIRGDDTLLVDLQGEHWQCLGVLTWEEDEKLA